jgi:hypothetical protein
MIVCFVDIGGDHHRLNFVHSLYQQSNTILVFSNTLYLFCVLNICLRVSQNSNFFFFNLINNIQDMYTPGMQKRKWISNMKTKNKDHN